MSKLGLLLAPAFGCLLVSSVGAAEKDQRRWELAFDMPVTRLMDFHVTEPGFGLQGSFQFGEWAKLRLNLDSAVDYFPGIHSFRPGQKRFPYWRSAEEVSKSQFIMGLRAGKQWRGAEFFGKFRPGAFRFSGLTLHKDGACMTVWPIPEGCFAVRSKLRPAIDIGGGIVLPSNRRWFLRMDAGDNLVHYDSDLLNVPYIGTVAEPMLNRRPDGTPSDGAWKSHLQLNIGFGIRF